jgi:hypothetical protein
MNPQPKNFEEKLDQLIEDVREIKIVLKGYNGYPGLCQRHEELSKDHFSLRRLVIGLICVLSGTGLISGGTVGILKLIGGE